MNSAGSVPIERFEPIAWILFLAGLLLILGLMWDMLRRGKDFPAVYHGLAVIPGRWVRWLWVLALYSTYLTGGRAVLYSYYEENGVRQLTPVAIDTVALAEISELNTVESASGMTNLPFYESEYSSVVYRDGRSRRAANHRIVIPWVFFLLVAAYAWTIRGYHRPGGQPPHWVLEDEPWLHG